jgi:hypothetical protein
MRVEQRADGSLLLTYDSVAWSRAVFVLAAGFIGWWLFEAAAGRATSERGIGLAAGAVVLGLVGTVLFEDARTVVDPASRTLAWTRRWAFRRRSGTVAFADVAGVIAERPIGDHGIPSRRLVVRTRAGEMIPLTAGYGVDHGDALLAAASRISTLIGLAATPPHAVEPLLAAGRTIDAIRQLRETEGLSLEEAKRRVDAMRRPSARRDARG